MKAVKYSLLALAMSATFVACGGGKPKNTVAMEKATAGRDKELFKNAVSDIRNGHEDSGRILLNTILNTYPDSPLVKTAKLAMADSFYLEGGTKNLAQAEAGYRDFLQFFPTDPLDDDVMIKIAEIHMRQVQAADRDTTHAKAAERELKELIKLHPDSRRRKEADERLTEVQEYLAMHELKVAKFYYQIRQAPTATEQRTDYILKNYPNFSHMDEALYYHARAMADQEDTETASQNLSRLLREYPKSDFAGDAKKMLEKWKKPVPDPDPDPAKATVAVEHHTGVVPKVFGLVFGPKVNGLSQQGVVIDRTLKTEEIVARAQELTGLKPDITPDSASAPAASVSSNDANRPRRSTNAGQDVEVKQGAAAGSSSDQTTTQTGSDKSSKDKKKKKKAKDDQSSQSKSSSNN